MQIKTTKFLDQETFKRAYKKTIFPGVYYLDIKAPIAAQYELTGGCNQKCIFCYNLWKEGCYKNKDTLLSKDKQFKILDLLLKNEIFDIVFSGGEALLVPWLNKLIERASKAGVNVTLITNGILLDRKKAVELKVAGLRDLQISLHHYNPKINDKLTYKKGSFNKTVKGIKNSINIFGGQRVNVNMVALPETYKDVYKMAKFLSSIGVYSFTVASPTATGEMHNDKKMVITKKMFLDIYKQLILAEKSLGIKVGFTGGFPLCILPEINNKTISMISNYCDAGLNQIVIDPEGNIKPCVCLNEIRGNILKDDLKKIWSRNKFLVNIRRLKYLPKECKNCKYASLCRGGCRASAKGYYGNLNSRDPLM
jgi:radical SAM protein with 4Fe4S-binding SPASM domain